MCEGGGGSKASRSDAPFPTADLAVGPRSLCPILEPGRRGAGSARNSGCTLLLIVIIVINSWGLWRVI